MAGELVRLSDLRFEPDKSKLWDAHPGTVYAMENFVATPRGSYATFGNAVALSGTFGTEKPIIAYIFTNIDGTTRHVVGTSTKIDEYSSSAGMTKSNVGTGYTNSGATWSMAVFGNSIIAVNRSDATQVSAGPTFGTAFAALGGSPPKALIVVVQSNFVLLFNITDGVTSYEDGWQCSGLMNSTSWTTVGGAANLATQANNGRLLMAPGPIRAAVAFKDSVVVFKDDAIIVGTYSGNPNGFSWRLVTNQVGCSSMHGVCEHRGKLYFWHSSGFYSFDGSALQNIGDLAINTKVFADFTWGTSAGVSIENMYQANADDAFCNVLFLFRIRTSETSAYNSLGISYNSVSGKWGIWRPLTVAERINTNDAILVKHRTSQLFIHDPKLLARFLYWKWVSAGTTLTCRSGLYAESTATPNADGASISIAMGSRDATKLCGSVAIDYGTYRDGSASDPTSGMAIAIAGGQSPAALTNMKSSGAFTYNALTYTHNGSAAGKFFDVVLTSTAACDIDAINLEMRATGRQ